MEICPALGYDELNNVGHDQESESAKSGRQSNDEQDWERDLGHTIEVCQKRWCGQVVNAAEDMQLKFIFEEERCSRSIASF